MEYNMSTISPLIIDLGANNTGILMPHFDAGNGLDSAILEGLVIHIPDDKIKFAQVARRAKRHQRRGALRRKMAKRLFRLIMAHDFGFDVNQQLRKVQEALHHAFNNRGFTFLDEGLDGEAVDKAAADGEGFHTKWFPDIFTDSGVPLSEQLMQMSADIDTVKKLMASEPFSWNKDEEKRNIADLVTGKPQQKIILSGFRALKNFVVEVHNSGVNGHKPRHEYLKNIATDLAASELLKDVWTATGLSAEDAARLIGHISNLQLRVMRKYFNDKEMAGKGDGIWIPARMAQFFRRYIKSWHAKSLEEKQRKAELLAAMATHGDDIIALWRSTDPALSIPPMEDMNNRHPTKCASLLLDEEVLDARLPGWQDIPSRLMDTEFEKAFGAETVPAPARRLQAILDRSKEHDQWHLRQLAFRNPEKPLREQVQESLGHLQQVFGEKTADSLVAYAHAYYTEREASDHGDWNEAYPGRVLKICGRNCPRKSKVMHLQIGILFRRPFAPEDVESLRKEFSERVTGNSTLRSIAENAAEAQKTYGAAFKELLMHGKTPELKKLLDLATAAHCHLAERFGFNADDTDRFGKPFVLAQLYNMLETDSHGSSSTCQACSEDNARRSRPFAEGIAHARRLPADAGRPFDGLLARILERQAYEVAKAKVAQMAVKAPADGSVFMPIILEQNSFEFSLGLLSIRKKQIPDARKTSARREKGIAEGEESVTALWQDKAQRIKADSGRYCPYTGGNLTDRGQIDHIIPRSLSRNWGGTVYNTEANLVYCSIKGNTDKDDVIYDISRLHSRYLAEQFGTDERTAIEALIRERLPRLLQDPQAITGFHGLPQEDRKIIRHALFVDGLREDVLRALQQQKKARVNGTQKWFAKMLSKNIRELAATQLPGTQIETRTYLVKAEEVYALRNTLASGYADFAKTQPQPAFSHVVDAGMAWAVWLAMSARAQESIHIPENSLDSPAWLRSLLPAGIGIRSLESKSKARKLNPESQPLFKDGIFGNRFLSLVVQKDGTAAFGFHPKNAIAIGKNPEKAFALLLPLLRWEGKPLRSDWTEWSGMAVKSKRAFVLAVDRTAALDFLHKAAKEKIDIEDSARADLLDALAYNVQKIEINNALIKQPDTGKSVLLPREKVLASEKKPIEASFKISMEYGPCKAKGALIHPALASWQAILDDPLLAPHWGQALPADFKWDALYARHFPRQTADNAHKKVRKVFSLPIPAAPSGGFRIRRVSCDGTPVWQTVATEGQAYDRFAVEDGKPDLNAAKFASRLVHSPRLHPISYRHQVEDSGECCMMDEWLPVNLPEDKAPIIGIEIAPGTANRLYIRITMKGEAFAKAFGQPNPLSMPADWKWEQWPLDITNPRSHLFFEQVGETVRFWYIATGAPAPLCEAYAAAWKAKHGT